MDIFVCSRYCMLLFGMSFNDRRTQSSRHLGIALKLYHILVKGVFLMGVLQVIGFALATENPEFRALLVLIMGYYGLNAWTLFNVSAHIHHLALIVSKIETQLTPKELRYLRRRDVVSFVVRCLFLFLSASLLIGEICFTGTSDNIKLFEMLFKRNVRIQVIFISLFMLCFTSTFLFIVLSATFYHQIARVVRIYTINHQEQISSIVEQSFISGNGIDRIRKLLRDSNSFIQAVNRHFGAIPFSQLCILFLNIILGFTFTIVYNEMGDMFKIDYGVILVIEISLVLGIVCESSKISKSLKKSIETASTLTTIRLIDVNSKKLKEYRRNLTTFLQNTPFETLTAMDWFVLDVPLLFSLGNSVVPFTIMVITAVSEMRKNNKHPPS